MSKPVSLQDKYEQREGRVYLTGIQALVRLPLEQRWRDVASGLNTSGLISGYRGSPLGTYDQALWRAKRELDAGQIVFRPGLNEDLAATALIGSQQVSTFGKATCDGVFGLWYGKNPGLDRSGDAIRHGNTLGVARHGGVLAVVGDDHAAKSSDTCNQCEPALMALKVPVLAPSDIQEVLDLGLFGWALSRYSGLWAGLKVLPHHMDCSASIKVGPERGRYCLPTDFSGPPGDIGMRWPDDRFEQEARMLTWRLPAVEAFIRANGVNRIVFGDAGADIGLVAAGKVYQDVLQALAYLGIGEADAARLGLKLFKPAVVWPLERQGLLQFARGLKEILVIEEKEPILETQIKDILYNQPRGARPRVFGKHGESGQPLIPIAGELEPVFIARRLAEHLLARAPNERVAAALAELNARLEHGPAETGRAPRIPYFCAGCPHSRSLRVPDGARALAGIGCHWMAVWTPQMQTEPALHMGGEGANWIGQAPFSETRHVFQNLGDGTYAHSGSLAIRAAVAAGVNITYKILYNDAVAMTGGQPVDGAPTVEQIARQLAAEGVCRIEIVSEQPERFATAPLGKIGASVHRRDQLLAVERALSAVPGVTAIIYDQTCAAEKRRRRKRGTAPVPARRMYINSAVCEGCGDCGQVSNCVAIEPLETDLGRKRTINQTMCNQDYSCSDGFCPSFVSVTSTGRVGGGKPPLPPFPPQMEAPGRAAPLHQAHGIIITGIGGTGVVTVGAIMGMAAHLDGLGVSVLDSIGLAQKNGAVVSYVKIAARQEDICSARIAVGEADVLLGCDMQVASERETTSRLRAGRTRAIVNTHLAPTAQFVFDPDLPLDPTDLAKAVSAHLSPGHAEFLDAQKLAEGLFGDAVAANLMVLGYAFQKGWIPISHASLRLAIELNGVAVSMNELAFEWGRCAAVDLDPVKRAAGVADPPAVPVSLEAFIEGRADDLTAYQNARYARRYRRLVEGAAAADRKVMGAQSDRFAWAVARAAHKVMAYKDEYEVARLLTAPSFKLEIEQAFGRGARMTYHLAPPLLAKVDKATGIPRKLSFGAWLDGPLRLLAALRHLRGTGLDPFGWTGERRAEVADRDEYEALVAELVGALDPHTYDLACDLAEGPLKIRGYGHVKQRNRRDADSHRERRLMSLRNVSEPSKS
ncbi:indolepyruvate ferredoxin oxidoreductase family protein [Phenylobacterium sp. LH3H17]|uniref:indolepyruvate ferredoxin oxidoreductase family protein n=1 Tax=Phenylobacterium sp. LH3H17 TaxID=2903901 RepID=UPI0020C9B10B|nr:indolepyruvate ferredoxin oxidoreductase family protein [Phenylobacterium sp. LH3H17]UTP38282.1 indolepyruvate ferredoxin oxidoreductase family protein [Phenylobacterium sp. LH3H17]